MIDDAMINPFNTKPEAEFPHPIQPVPLWSEYNYFFGYDPVSQCGISMHVGREPYDPSIWRATFGIYLPGGEELLVAKCSGRDGHARGAGAGPIRVTCVQPFRLWTLEFDGTAQPASRAENMAAAHMDTPGERVRFFLRFEGAAPFWDLHALMKGQAWASEHYEQMCRVRGEIQFRGKTLAIDGGGVRDHSVGPRDYGAVVGDFWLNMLFENGAAIMAQTVRTEGNADIARGYVFRNDGNPLEITEVVEGPVVNTVDTPRRSVEKDPMMEEALRKFHFVIKTKRGLETIQGEIVHSVATSYIAPNDELLGTSFHLVDRGQPKALQLTESATIYTWNGVKGVGTRERVARIATLK
ncbi:MAG: hypothetical protein ABW034_21850 [Steroidobacteraceae bacterium]